MCVELPPLFVPDKYCNSIFWPRKLFSIARCLGLESCQVSHLKIMQMAIRRVTFTSGNTYVHTYIPTYIHPYIHTSMHTNIHTYIYIHPYIHTYIHPYIHACIHTSIHPYIHAFMHACTHVCIYIYHHIGMLPPPSNTEECGCFNNPGGAPIQKKSSIYIYIYWYIYNNISIYTYYI